MLTALPGPFARLATGNPDTIANHDPLANEPYCETERKSRPALLRVTSTVADTATAPNESTEGAGDAEKAGIAWHERLYVTTEFAGSFVVI